MARVLIIGGGFAGVVAAESLAQTSGDEHHITLISRHPQFLFYPALVRLAFGKEQASDISFDLREAMLDRRVTFVEGEVARVDVDERFVKVSRGDFVGEMHYDFLVLAIGRRLATERVHGFFEHAHHLLNVPAALKFRDAIRQFNRGRVIVGQCPGARLPVPIFEAAFSLSKMFVHNGLSSVTIVANETVEEMFDDTRVGTALREAMNSHGIVPVTDFDIVKITDHSVIASDGRTIECDLPLITPPFAGPDKMVEGAPTDSEGYLQVDEKLRVRGLENVYAAGDCVSLPGPKLGHMAVRQGEILAENVASQIRGHQPTAIYQHELMLVIDAGGVETMFLHKRDSAKGPVGVRKGRFWEWAKLGQERYWMKRHG